MVEGSTRSRAAAWRRRGQRALVAATAALLVACTSPGAEPPAGPEPRPSRSAAPSPRSTSPGAAAGPSSSSSDPRPTPGAEADLPTAPAVGDAAALARQLDRAVATVRSRDAAAVDVRLAAELHQLAVRSLGTRPDDARRRVMARLRPATRRFVRGDVRAAMLLHEMSSPQPALPRWRIVTPPPASELLGYYRAAQRRTGVPWTYLAAIHLVETRMGRIRGVSTAGARGPMQFLPATWDLYGAGGDIDDPRDAIMAAGRLLRANGAPADLRGALFHYNQSDNYVQAVIAHARTMQRWSTAYRGYWHWRVLYRHVRGTYVLPEGYPQVRAVRLRNS
jgi:hypothetical protein